MVTDLDSRVRTIRIQILKHRNSYMDIIFQSEWNMVSTSYCYSKLIKLFKLSTIGLEEGFSWSACLASMQKALVLILSTTWLQKHTPSRHRRVRSLKSSLAVQQR